MNANIALTLILLALMTGAGVVSASYGFAIGREALKGITQPDIRPINTVNNRKNKAPQRAQSLFLKEEKILSEVKAQIEGDGKEEPRNRNKALTPTESNPEQQKNEAQKGFPIKSVDRGVTLEVVAARQQGGSLLLDLKLRNSGEQPVRFLYSFLNVTDNRGRVLSASTEGLPTELPAQSQSFSGTVRISTVQLDNADKLSLTLTDYPDQQLKLKASGIPVVK
ncbi:MAG: hypothetical protein SFW36_01625 [Leptolyngbyaceae cyanobacterium bins.59]|nr:hypothetical protein [Leptolyngbyaceae cyanobacterium bins.59]